LSTFYWFLEAKTFNSTGTVLSRLYFRSESKLGKSDMRILTLPSGDVDSIVDGLREILSD
jgi:hypothetical protein